MENQFKKVRHHLSNKTIRKDFAENVEANSVHGSDSPETAAEEISYFFSQIELIG